MELLKKHDSLCRTVASVRDDLNETKIQISPLAEKENQVPVTKGKKRAYPNALSVSCCTYKQNLMYVLDHVTEEVMCP